MDFSLEILKAKYDLELDRVVGEMKKSKAKTVLIQLPDGMKPYGPEIVDYLVEKTSAEISIWFGSCFGACDLPKTNADLVVQFGHAPWK